MTKATKLAATPKGKAKAASAKKGGSLAQADAEEDVKTVDPKSLALKAVKKKPTATVAKPTYDIKIEESSKACCPKSSCQNVVTIAGGNAASSCGSCEAKSVKSAAKIPDVASAEIEKKAKKATKEKEDDLKKAKEEQNEEIKKTQKDAADKKKKAEDENKKSQDKANADTIKAAQDVA